MADCEHDWEQHESICTYSNGDIQRASTCKRCGENQIAVNGTVITEEQAQGLIDKLQAGELTALWSMEGSDRQWAITPIL